MAADGSTEDFQSRASFFILGDFPKIAFLEMSSIKLSFRISKNFFLHLGRGTEKRAQSQKRVF